MRVVFDANGLMTPSQHNVDVFDEAERLIGGYDAVVPDAVVRELKALADKGDKDAAVGLRFAEERCEVVDTEPTHGDDAVVETAEATEGDSAVVTNDAKLKDRLLERNVPVLYLRQKNRLEAEYP
ncbi:twitching motility protein PilT [Haladaptatus sp. F3-133]|jgi:rRNA-processing protein FCF1|uniref:Twitching motility protein PilT n=1 Tax=Halorutilus salinus TaxID=2487751 RepID=A0A9Q4C7V9_9EURY|nr:PIN domain-containing protein [Halorutilus salinus]MCX2820029.1 twitching motility protein PilT [Halorutilus salinus]